MVSPPNDRRGTVPRAAPPDPALWRSHSHHGASVRRITIVAAGLVLALALSAVALRAVLARSRSAAGLLPGAQPDASGLPLGSEPVTSQGRRASPEELAELQKSWVGSESFAPRADRVDPATGERVAPFHGFGLQIDSEPSGARVLVDGEEMGKTPLLTTVSCRPGDQVAVQLERGEQRARVRTRCRQDALVKLQLGLK